MTMTDQELQTQDSDTPLKRARILHDLGRSEELLALLMPIIDTTDNSGAAYALCVSALIDLDRRQDAVKLSEQGVVREPDNAVMYQVYATALTWVRKDKEALAAADQALALEPEYGDAHGTCAFALNRLGRNHEALESIRTALELRPNDADFLLTLARVEYALGNKDVARNIVDDVLADSPTHAEALAYRGSITDEVEQKTGLFRQALRFAPNNSQYAEQYALYTTHLQRDAFLCACLPLLVLVLYASRHHPVTGWMWEHFLLLALASGFILIKPTSEHAIKYMFALFFSLILYTLLEGTFSSGLGGGFFGGLAAVILKLAAFALLSFFGTLAISLINDEVRGRFNIFMARSDNRRAYLDHLKLLRETAHSAVMAIMPTLLFWSYNNRSIPYLLYFLVTLPLIVFSATGVAWRSCINASWRYAIFSLGAMGAAWLMLYRWPDMVAGSYIILFLLAFLLAQWQINRLKSWGG